MSEAETLDTLSLETKNSSGLPTISMDRALAHFFTELNVDPEILSNYYDSLPHDNKPPLRDLWMHFSASPVSRRTEDDTELVTSGVTLWRGTRDLKSTTPELPETFGPTIITYIGSALILTETDSVPYDSKNVATHISQTARHELAHYAQGPPKSIDKVSRFNKIKDEASLLGATALLGLVKDGRWRSAGMAGLAASEIFSDNSLPTSLKVAGATAAMVHIAGRKKRGVQQEDQYHDHYLEYEGEVDARLHDKAAFEIVKFNALDVDADVLKSIAIPNDRGMRATRHMARKMHKDLALKSPKL